MYVNPVVDAHIHLTENGGWISNGYDASLTRLTDEMAKAGIDYGILLSLASLEQDRFISRTCQESGGKLFALASHQLGGDMGRLRDLLGEPFFKGVKLHPRLGAYAPNDERLYPFYEEAADKGWVINFDALGHSTKLPLEEIRPTAFDRLAKRYPSLKMVLSHCGVPWIMEAFFVAKSNENLHLDCSFIIDRYQGSSIHTDLQFLAMHLDRKLVYGSDFPERSVNRYLSIARVSFNNLSAEKRANIFGLNAVALYGLDR